MSFFGKNIKKIRTVKKLSQSAFAELFKLKRGSIGAYEEGRAEAKIDTIIKIAGYFKLSLNQLLISEITINEIYHIDSVNKKLYQVKPDNNIPFVSRINKTTFIQSHHDENFIDNLPKICLPAIKQKSIAFESFDSSMLGQFSGIKEGDILIAQSTKFNDIEKLQTQSVIIVLHENDLIIGIPEIKGENLILTPLNMNYQKHFVEIADTKKMWLVNKIITDSFLKDTPIDQRIQIIENRLDGFEASVKSSMV